MSETTVSEEHNALDKIHQAILGQLEQQRQLPPPAPDYQAQRLGHVLQAYLINCKRRPEDLAFMLGVDVDLIKALLNAMIPSDELDEEFLDDIARAIGYEPTLLSLIIHRPVEVDWTELNEAEVYHPQSHGRMYYCGQEGCPGHFSFSQICNHIAVQHKASGEGDPHWSQIVQLEVSMAQERHGIRESQRELNDYLETLEILIQRIRANANEPAELRSSLIELERHFEQFTQNSEAVPPALPIKRKQLRYVPTPIETDSSLFDTVKSQPLSERHK